MGCVQREVFYLPEEPIQRAAPALAWPAIALPIVMSLAFFLITSSPYSLVFAALSPVALLTSATVNRRRSRKQYQQARVDYDRDVAELRERVMRFHEQEREQWLRLHPDAFVLGWGEHPSAASCVGSVRTEFQRSLHASIERNPSFPFAVERTNGQAPELTLAFDGVLSRALRARARAAQVTVRDDPHQLPTAQGGSHRYLQRQRGLVTLHSGERVHVVVHPQPRGRVVTSASINHEPGMTLSSPLGRSPDDKTVFVDLVHDGPHALIAGTTGSGKSELLRTLVTTLAQRYSPNEVQFLLIDFKGGATFQPFEVLPHTLEVLTDLEPELVTRTVSGLRAELRRREQVLRAARLSDISQLSEAERIARLVIVVDEFATLMTELPEAHAAFADVAARGRALGVHLVLATQRPAGAIRDSLAANCTLRLCLRVANAHESHAVLGSDQAARLHSMGVGACIQSSSGELSTPWFVSRSDPVELEAIRARWSGQLVRETPWLPPLPEVLEVTTWPALPPRHWYLGLNDQPDLQRQDRVVWNAASDPFLLVLGGRRSGKSTLLAALHAQGQSRGSACRIVPVAPRPDAVWDALTALHRAQTHRAEKAGQRETLWLCDDIDFAWEQFSTEHEMRAREMLGSLLRRAPSGHAIGMSLQRIPPMLASTLQSVEHRVVLRAASREQHLGWGLALAGYSANAHPGRGVHAGDVIQTPFAEVHHVKPASTPSHPWPRQSNVALVSERAVLLSQNYPDTVGEQEWLSLADHWSGGAMTALQQLNESAAHRMSGTVEEWSAILRQSAAVRSQYVWVFDDCALADVRQILGRVGTPPPVTDVDVMLAWASDGGFSRVRLRADHSDTVVA